MTAENVDVNNEQQFSDILSKRDCAREVIMRLKSKMTSELVGLIASILLFGSNLAIIQIISIPLVAFFIFKFAMTSKEIKYIQNKYKI